MLSCAWWAVTAQTWAHLILFWWNWYLALVEHNCNIVTNSNSLKPLSHPQVSWLPDSVNKFKRKIPFSLHLHRYYGVHVLTYTICVQQEFSKTALLKRMPTSRRRLMSYRMCKSEQTMYNYCPKQNIKCVQYTCYPIMSRSATNNWSNGVVYISR